MPKKAKSRLFRPKSRWKVKRHSSVQVPNISSRSDTHTVRDAYADAEGLNSTNLGADVVVNASQAAGEVEIPSTFSACDNLFLVDTPISNRIKEQSEMNNAMFESDNCVVNIVSIDHCYSQLQPDQHQHLILDKTELACDDEHSYAMRAEQNSAVSLCRSNDASQVPEPLHSQLTVDKIDNSGNVSSADINIVVESGGYCHDVECISDCVDSISIHDIAPKPYNTEHDANTRSDENSEALACDLLPMFDLKSIALDQPNLPITGVGDIDSVSTAVQKKSDLTSAIEQPNQTFLFKVEEMIKPQLHSTWGTLLVDDALHILMFSSGQAKLVQRSLMIFENGECEIFVHGCRLQKDNVIFKSISDFNLTDKNPVLFVSNVLKIVRTLREFEICCGAPKTQYQRFWTKVKNAYVDRNDFQEQRFTKTCRSETCNWIVPQLQKQCGECRKTANQLIKEHYKTPKLKPDGKVVTPHKNKPYKYLSTPEKIAKHHRLMNLVRCLKRKNAALQEKIESLVHSEAVDVSEELNSDLEEMIFEGEENGKIEDIHRLFLQEQIKCCRVKGATGMRWHPAMIRFALQLKLVSSTAFNLVKSSGFIKLPSERLLFDFSHALDIKEGCHPQIIEEVAEVVRSLPHDYQKNHALSFDEVHISQNIVKCKTTGEVVGYCKLDTVNEEFENLDKIVDETATGCKSVPDKSPPITKKMLSFMVKGTASHVRTVVASYGVSTLVKEDLHKYCWEVIENLEMSGVRVCALVCDGSSVNRGFFDMQKPATITDSGVVFDTVNLYDTSRRIFFISDPPHLIKTIRNCFANSGRQKSRKLFKNGQYILWETIVKLYKCKSNQTVKMLHKLDAACVFLNSYSKMKVKYAARVLSNSVANALDILGWENVGETSIFKEM